jgi:hypothetical protein
MVTRTRTWGWSRIWEEKLVLVRTCHSGRPAVAPKLDAARDCSATRRKAARRRGHAGAKRRPMAMAAAVLAAGRGRRPGGGSSSTDRATSCVSREKVKSGSGSVWLLLPGSCVLLQHERFVGNEAYL